MPDNPKRYRAMSEPFPSSDAAEEAIKGFFEEAELLRVKHRLRDVYIIIGGTVMYGDDEGGFITSGMIGDTGNAESMAAWALGHESAARQTRIAKILGSHGAIKKRP